MTGGIWRHPVRRSGPQGPSSPVQPVIPQLPTTLAGGKKEKKDGIVNGMTWAVEMLHQEVGKRGSNVPSCLLGGWEKRRVGPPTSPEFITGE